jgi:hypothetical protein
MWPNEAMHRVSGGYIDLKFERRCPRRSSMISFI